MDWEDYEQVQEARRMLADNPDKRYAVIPSNSKYCDVELLSPYNEAFSKFVKSEGSLKMVKVTGYDPIFMSNYGSGLEKGVYAIIKEVLMYRD